MEDGKWKMCAKGESASEIHWMAEKMEDGDSPNPSIYGGGKTNKIKPALAMTDVELEDGKWMEDGKCVRS